MSSIMDELRRLQGKRSPGRPSSMPDTPGVPDEPGRLDVQLADSPGTPVLTDRTATEQTGRRTALLVGGLIAALAVAVALSVSVLGGRRQDESEAVVLASRQVAPEKVAQPVKAESPVGAEEPIELAADVEPGPAAGAADTAMVLARLHVLETIETFDEPRFEPVEPPRAEAQDAEPTTQPDQQLAEAASVELGEAPAAPSPEPVEKPVHILTRDEDEANKTAIRSLKVFGVLADDDGVGVYTSEGELRTGDRFNGMTVTEVTSRYVVFERGNKRYRWMLPHRRARAERDAS
jgi:hypothetical protein